MGEKLPPRHVRATVSDAVLVVLSNRDGAEGHRLRDDLGDVAAFLEWQGENQVFPISGGTTSRGFYSAVFDRENGDAVATFLRGRGLEVHRPGWFDHLAPGETRTFSPDQCLLTRGIGSGMVAVCTRPRGHDDGGDCAGVVVALGVPHVWLPGAEPRYKEDQCQPTP